jgi:hypothetical protein
VRESDNKDGFTMVDNFSLDVILPMLSTAAQSIFLRIYRQTVGWTKLTDKISNGQFGKACHIKNHETVQTAVGELEALDLIIVKGHRTQIKEYAINTAVIVSLKDKYDEGLDDAEQ